MRSKIFYFFISCCVIFLFAACAYAQPLPDYKKIVVLRLDYDDGAYQEVAKEVRYGNAPNIYILSGNLKGVIVDDAGKEITTFSLSEPDIVFSDAISDTLGISENNPAEEYIERFTSHGMVITLPYLKHMQSLRLYDTRDSTLLITVDLSPSLAGFCTDYPNDPDCLCCVPSYRTSSTGAKDSFMYLTIFAVALAVLVILPVAIKLRKTSPDILKKQTILVVDDDPDIVELITVLLDRQGYRSITAQGGRECLDILTQKKDLPDLILLDIMMEPMDGWQTLEQIKSKDATKQIPVLMLTGKQLTAAEAKQYHICIEDYIMKPFTNNQLYAAIEYVLNRKQNIYKNIVLAKKAGIAQDTYCEYAKLSKRVDVNKKLIGILQKSYGMPEPGKHGTGDALDIIEQMITNTRSNEDRLLQLQREIFSAFTAKGYPVPIW